MRNKVVHYKRDAYDVYIGRPTKWGNPFIVGKDGAKGECVELYREWIVKQPELLADLHELKDKVLGCWCAPNVCHGDVLAELVELHCSPQLMLPFEEPEVDEAKPVHPELDELHCFVKFQYDTSDKLYDVAKTIARNKAVQQEWVNQAEKTVTFQLPDDYWASLVKMHRIFECSTEIIDRKDKDGINWHLVS